MQLHYLMQVARIDVKDETPVDHGEIVCFSIYSGSEADFGDGKSCIWVDVLDGGGKDILLKFVPFFENSKIKKVTMFFLCPFLLFTLSLVVDYMGQSKSFRIFS